MLLKQEYALREHNTFRMDVYARWFAEYNSIDELRKLLDSALLKKNPFFHIGEGSNLLFTKDYNGVILHSGIRYIRKEREDENHVWVKVGAGIIWDELCAYCVDNNWGGLENLSYIPGEVGSSAVQNIGAYGVEVCDLIEEVEAVDIQTRELLSISNKECGYGYRESKFKKEWRGKYIITSVLYRLDKHPVFKLEYGNLQREFLNKRPISLAAVREIVIEIRKQKLPDPKEYGNAGSFFMNPIISIDQYNKLKEEYPLMPHYVVDDSRVKVPAAWMIEQCGWKGKAIGDAAVHEKQCLVLINKGHATAEEIIELASEISKSVKRRFDVNIYPEVNYI